MGAFDLEDDPQAPAPANPELDSLLEFGRVRQQAHEIAMRRSVQQTADTNPETAAQARKLSIRLGVPADVVARDLPTYQRQDQTEKPYTAIQQQTPATAEFIKDPAKLAIAKDDLENLGALEWLVTAPQRAFARGVNQVRFAELRHQSLFRDLTVAERGMLDTYQQQMTAGGELGTDGSWFRGAVRGFAEQLPNTFGALLKGAHRGAQSAAFFGTAGALAGAAAGPAAPFTAATGLAAGFEAGMVYGSAEFGFQLESGLAYDEYLGMHDEHGKPLDPQVAKAAALAAGAINAGLEAAGIEVLAKTIPGLSQLTGAATRSAVKEALRVPTVRAGLLNAVKSYGHALAAETATEVAQRAITIIAGELAKSQGGVRPAGMLEEGNVNLYQQPRVQNPDGTRSTVDSLSVNLDGREVLLPTVTPEGKHFTGTPEEVEAQAVGEFRRTGRHLGAFTTPAAATTFAEQLHQDYEAGRYDQSGFLRTPGEIAGDLYQEFTGALQSMSLMVLPGPTLAVAHDLRRARAAEHNATFFKALAQGVKQSKTIERMPEAAQELLAQATKDGPLEHVYAPTSTFAEYWQSQNVDPKEMAAELTGDPEAWDTAVNTGEDLRIPTARYAVKLAGTEHHAYFAEELRLQPDQMNHRESVAFAEQLKAAQREAAEPTQQELDLQQVQAQLSERLTAAGVPATMVQKYTAAVLGFAGTFAESEGIRPTDVIGPINVVRPDLEQARGAGRAATAPALGTTAAPAVEPTAVAPSGAQEAPLAGEAGRPGASFLGHGPDGPLYNWALPDGTQTTGDLAGLQAAGYAVPPTPEPTGERLNGEQLRARALAARAVAAAPQAEAAVAAAVRTEPGAVLPAGTKDRLREAGYSLEAIDRMTPAEARQALVPPAAVGLPVPGARPMSEYAASDLANEAERVEAMQRGTRQQAPPRVATALDIVEDGDPAKIEAAYAPEPVARETTDPSGLRDEGGVAASRPRERETDRQRQIRHDTHYLDIFSDLLTAARALDPAIDPERLRHEFQFRLAAYEEMQQLEAESGRDPLDLLRAISAAGGIGPETGARAGGYTGEVKWLKDGAKFGRVHGVQVFRARSEGSATGARTGLSLDGMLEALRQEPRFQWIENINQLIDVIDDAIRHPPDVDQFLGTDDLRAALQIKRELAWWLDPWAPQNLLAEVPAEEEALTSGEGPVGDTSFDVSEFEQGQRDLFAEPATEDMLETGEVQPRLPGAEAVRETEIATPQMEAPFSLTSEVAQPKPKQQTFFQAMQAALTEADVQAFVDDLKAQLPDLTDLDIRLTPQGDLHLETIAAKRGTTGSGTRALQAITRWADAHKKRITLALAEKGYHPTDVAKQTTSNERLRRFYRQFGFRDNRGRTKDYRLSIYTSMYREPTLRGGDLELNQPLQERPPVFYSRLVRAVQDSTQAKASGAQWKATIRNSKIGINKDEFALASVGDLDDGTSYTKQEILDYLATNEVRLEVRQLTEEAEPTEEQIAERDRQIEQQVEERYQAALDHTIQTLEEDYPDLDYFIAGDQLQPRIEVRETDDPAGGWEALVNDDDLGYVYDTEEEAREAAEAEADRLRLEAEEQATEERDRAIRLRAEDRVDRDAIERDVRAEADVEEETPEGATRYGTYVLPGGDPGSYREVFIQAPQLPGQRSREARNAEYRRVTMIANRPGYAEVRQNIYGDRRWYPVTLQGTWAALGYDTQAEAQQQVDPEIKAASVRVQAIQNEMATTAPTSWEDGHEEYSDIENPIVRIRLNTRTATDGSRVLFLEEVQPPHPQEQEKMPALFQKNWREIAFKWALRQAAEQGLDVVAWTTGEQQAARYSLEKHVDEIRYRVTAEGRYAIVAYKDGRSISGTEKSNLAPNELAAMVGKEIADRIINREGQEAPSDTMVAFRARGRPVEVFQDPAAREHLGQWFIRYESGKTMGSWLTEEDAQRDLQRQLEMFGEEPERSLTGEGLKIGGEGLKRLYDVDFRNVVKGLPAVKRNGGAVEMIPIGSTAAAGRTLQQIDADMDALIAEYQRLKDEGRETPAIRRLYDARYGELQGERNRAQQTQPPPIGEQPGIRLTPQLREAVLEGQALFQPAYHGSRHEVDRFSTAYVGTGEGAAAFGWGLYFAEDPAVAETYKRAGQSSRFTSITYEGIEYPPHTMKAEILADIVEKGRDAVVADLERSARFNEDYAPTQAALNRASAEFARKVNVERIHVTGAGAIYQVEIADTAIPQMLDWDSYLSEQPRVVREALRRVAEAAPEQPVSPYGGGGGRARLLQMLEPHLQMRGVDFYHQLEDALGGAQQASQALAKAGVPGLRYFDQGSRQGQRAAYRADPAYLAAAQSFKTATATVAEARAGLRAAYPQADPADLKAALAEAYNLDTRTRNIVVFDDRIVEITHKDGTPITAAQRREFLQGENETPTGPSGAPERRGSIRFGPGREITISLFEKADPSTLIHEFGHLFLRTMEDLEQRPEASPRLRGMLTTLRAWYAEHGIAPDDEVGRQELFARAFEQYAFEGKAPSLALRDVFAAFRAWMLGVYRSLRGLNITLTPEVRQVFDRMLATDQAIAEAQAAGKVAPMFLTAEQAGMSPQQFALYSKTIQDANRTATERLERKLLAEVRREQEAQWQAQRAEIKLQVQIELGDQPVYRALSLMRTGTNPDGSPISDQEAPQPWKLSRELLIQRYGAAKLKTLPAGIYSRAGGFHPDVVAEHVGFSSGDEMLNAIVGARPYQEAVETETTSRMIQQHGSMLLDGTLGEQAQAALSDETREQVLREELRALAKLRQVASPFVQFGEAQLRAERKERDYERRWFEAETKLRIAIAEGHKQVEIDKLAGEVRQLRQRARGGAATIAAAIPPAGQIREMARQRVAGMVVREIAPERFWAAAMRAGTQATALAARQDFDGAIVAKQQQLMNLALYREAMRVREDLDARVKRVQQLDSKASRAAIGLAGHTYQQQIDGLLDRYEFVRVPRKALDKRADLRRWVAAMEGEGLPVDLPEEVLNEARRVNYQDATVEEVIGVTDAILHIAHLARFKNRLLKIKAARELTALANDLARSIREKFTGRRPVLEPDRRPAEDRRRMFGDFFAGHRKLASLLREMDGWEDGGPMWEAIMRTLNEAGDREAVMTADATARLQAIVDRAYPGRQKAALYEKLEIPAIGMSLSKMSRLMVALNWGNEGNRDRVRNGRHWTDEQVRAILDTLDRRDLDFVQGVFDLIGSYREEIGAKARRVSGLEPTWVEATPITAQAGTIPGGYFPIKGDERVSGTAIRNQALEAANLARHAAYNSATTRRGHEKERQATGNQPVRLDFGPIFEHLGQVIHDLSHHEALLDVSRVLGQKAVQDAILETYGDLVYNQVRSAITDIAVGMAPARQGIEKGLNHLRQGATVVGLGWNLTTTLMQPLGLTNSIVQIGPKWVARGVMRWIRSEQSMVATVEWINEVSPMMRMRAQTQQREISEIRNKIGISAGRVSGWVDDILSTVTRDMATKAGIADSYFWFIQQAQRLADVPTWLGAYEKAMDRGEPEARAIALADQAVLDSQGGGQIKDLASHQRGGPWMKLWTNFYSFFNVVYQQEQQARGRFRSSDKDIIAVGRLASDYLMLFVVPSVLGYAIREALKPGDTPEDENLTGRLLAEIASYAAGTMLGLREIAGALQGSYGYEGPAGARAFASLSRFGVQLKQAVADPAKGLDAGLLRSAWDFGGIIFHYPAAQVRKSVEGLAALMEGQTANPLALGMGAPRKASAK